MSGPYRANAIAAELRGWSARYEDVEMGEIIVRYRRHRWLWTARLWAWLWLATHGWGCVHFKRGAP